MTRRFFRYENLLYVAAFFLALVLRMAGLGKIPLSDSEAVLALQALALSKGQETLINPHPAYLALSSFWIFLFGGSHWTARFWPAFAGSALVLCPVLFKRQIGKIPSLVLAFFLVFDPGMLAVSQQAGGPALALLFVLLFVGCILERKAAFAGIAAGMALLSGPDMWPGVLGIGLAFLVSQWIGFIGQKNREENMIADEGKDPPVLDFNWRKLLWFLLGTVFFAGTFFFSFPRGLSAMASGLPGYLQGWAVPSGIPALLLILSVIVYEFLLFFLGAWGAGKGLINKHPLDRFLVAWWLISFILALIYPGRQMTSIAWSILPLAVLAARQAVRMMNVTLDDWLPALGQAVLSGLILGFISLTALSMVNNPQFINEREYWIRLLGALIMLIASTALIAWGWSKEVSIRGLIWGCFAIFMIYSVSAAWNVANLSSRSGHDYWINKQVLPDEPLLLKTVDQLSWQAPPVSGGYDLVVADIPSPALKWALRGYSRVAFTSQLPTGTTPAFIITRDQPDLAFAVPYRGQSFVLFRDTGWSLLHSQEWLRWVAFRVVPEEVILKERIILWARTDLFPGGETETDPSLKQVQPGENPK